MKDIESITRQQANKIISTGVPKGLFITRENGLYVGIDNEACRSECFVEEFKDKRLCESWLHGDFEVTVE